MKLTREFGRVISHPRRHNGAPFLNGTSIKVEDILGYLAKGLSDADIIEKHKCLKQKHIDICRAYQARFMAHTQSDLSHLDENDKVFMLDENISYLLLYDIARNFGWSSHVLADNLYNENNDDEKNIWAHLITHKYKAILTEDSDFKRISRAYRRDLIAKYGSLEKAPDHVPAVIYFSKNASKEDIAAMLAKHEDDIRLFLQENDAAFATINGTGFTRHSPDSECAQKRPPQNRQAPR